MNFEILNLLFENPIRRTNFFDKILTGRNKILRIVVFSFNKNLWLNVIIAPHLTLFSAIFILFIAQNLIIEAFCGFDSHIRHSTIN